MKCVKNITWWNVLKILIDEMCKYYLTKCVKNITWWNVLKLLIDWYGRIDLKYSEDDLPFPSQFFILF